MAIGSGRGDSWPHPDRFFSVTIKEQQNFRTGNKGDNDVSIKLIAFLPV